MEECSQRAETRCLKSLESALKKTIDGYQDCTVNSQNAYLERGKVHYALLPVWLRNVKWEGETYLFAVNGQTGRTAGKLPASGAKALAFFLGLAVPLSALAVLLANMLA